MIEIINGVEYGEPDYEIINGEKFCLITQDIIGSLITSRIIYIFGNYIDKKNIFAIVLSRAEVHLSNDNCVRPQVNVISNKHQIKNGKYLEGAPDLIVEVLLSATIIKDCEIKKELYAKYGVKEYWIVNPWLKSITIYKLFDSRY